MDGPDGLTGITYGLPFSIPNNGQYCAQKVGLDWDSIQSCALGPQGAKLLHDSHSQTAALFKQHGGYRKPGAGYNPPYIPNIWIDGHEYNDPLVHARNPYADLLNRVCSAYKGNKPSVCTDLRDAGDSAAVVV